MADSQKARQMPYEKPQCLADILHSKIAVLLVFSGYHSLTTLPFSLRYQGRRELSTVVVPVINSSASVKSPTAPIASSYVGWQ